MAPIPTVNGTRPQAILHPMGNRGADLIETIRLERLAASIAAPSNSKAAVAPDRSLFIPLHHTQARVDRARPQTAAAPRTNNRPWAQPKWSRPQSASTLCVHSSEAFNELMMAPRETSEPSSRIPSRSASPTPSGKSSTSDSPAPLSKGRPASAHPGADSIARARQREKHEAMLERVQRKLKEAQAAAAQQREHDFQLAWQQHNAGQAGPVAEITEYLRLVDSEKHRRASAHCKKWNEEVYDKIHEQIAHQLHRRELKGTYNTRWRHAQDEYLRTTNSKEMGVFRDIVIPVRREAAAPPMSAMGLASYCPLT